MEIDKDALLAIFKEKRNEHIMDFKPYSTISYSDICRIFGKVIDYNYEFESFRISIRNKNGIFEYTIHESYMETGPLKEIKMNIIRKILQSLFNEMSKEYALRK